MKAELIFTFENEKIKFPVEWNNYDIIELSIDKNAEGIYFQDIYDDLWKNGNPVLTVMAENGMSSMAQYEELSGLFYSLESIDQIKDPRVNQ